MVTVILVQVKFHGFDLQSDLRHLLALGLSLSSDNVDVGSQIEGLFLKLLHSLLDLIQVSLLFSQVLVDLLGHRLNLLTAWDLSDCRHSLLLVLIRKW